MLSHFLRAVFIQEAYSKSCGSGIGETPQALRGEEAHRPPRGKRTSWSGNQPLYNTWLKSNKVCENSFSFGYDKELNVVFATLLIGVKIYSEA
nr:hypothetical protein [Bacillus sp. ISL-47]